MKFEIKRRDLLNLSRELTGFRSTEDKWVSQMFCRVCGGLVLIDGEKLPHFGDCWIAKALKETREIRTLVRK